MVKCFELQHVDRWPWPQNLFESEFLERYELNFDGLLIHFTEFELKDPERPERCIVRLQHLEQDFNVEFTAFKMEWFDV
jgi:hypothetical protein